jgi:signal transduction histidine kinase
MRERVRGLGGGFDITSSPGEGTRIEAWLPLVLSAAGQLSSQERAEREGAADAGLVSG